MPEAVRLSLRTALGRKLELWRRGSKDHRAGWDELPRSLRLELLAEFQCNAEAEVLEGSFFPLIEASHERLRVDCHDNQFAIIVEGGFELPVLLGNRVLGKSDFLAGWTAESLYRDFAPLYLLELRGSNGARAAWLLDGQLRQIGDVGHLPPEMKEVLLNHAIPVMDRHLRSVLAFGSPELDPVVGRYLELAQTVRDSLIRHGGGAIRPALTPVAARFMSSALAASLPSDDGQPVLLRREWVVHALSLDLHQRTLQATIAGRLDWPSPVDGTPASLRGVFTLDDYVFVYQFSDRNGVDFMLVSGDRSARVIGLVVPEVDLFLFDDQARGWTQDQWLRNERGGDFWSLLVRHVNTYPDEMAHRARTPDARPVNVLLSTIHIGHHLWNDLTGLEALCDAVPAERLPTTMILGAADGRAELFGPIDTLFPLLAGHVDRSLPGIDAFIRWTYRRDVWPCRITRDTITACLRERVTRHLESSEDADAVRRLHAGRRHPDAPVIIFGLRVEDRTFSDLEGFCAAFVAFIAERHPGATIVFDGHNRGPAASGENGAIIRGMAYSLASQPPDLVECQMVGRLAEHFARAPVTIIGTTGQSIATSLAWCRQADLAFAIWGAGLAKYRWLANLPTMMISTRANLLGRPDLAIYHDPRTVEAPAPYLFADPDWITDAGSDGALASGHVQGWRECFTADTALVLGAFDGFLRQVRTGPGGSTR